MGMTRQERVALHKKQERLQVKAGVPSSNELQEGVPVLRSTNEGVVQYIKYNGRLYKSIYEEAKENTISTLKFGSTDLDEPGYVTFGNGLIFQWGQTDSTGTPVTVTFPLEFNNECFVVCSNSMVETAVGGSDHNIAVQTYDYTTENFKARVLGGNSTDYGATNDGFAWIAIGY
jgi:hypothetical protein